MKRIFALLAALAMAGALSVSSPASASVSDCPNNPAQICIWNWINFNQAGGMWTASAATIANSSTQCWTLSNSNFTNGGGNVNDESAGIGINNSTSVTYRVIFYDWINCNESGPKWSYLTSAAQGAFYPSLWHTGPSFSGGGTMYDAITSVKVYQVA